MGILDEAIREHLELKRQHGADDSELKQLEDDAFGPPERPGSAEESSDPLAEAPTEFMSQPEGLEGETSPEGNGEPAGRRESTAGILDLQEAPAPVEPSEEEQPAGEHEAVSEPVADEAETERPADSDAAEDAPAAQEGADEQESADGQESADEPESADELAVGHTTEERHAIAEHPTELYDVEGEFSVSGPSDEEDEEAPAASADLEEEDEDFFSEQRLSEELDQALEAPTTLLETQPEPEQFEADEEVKSDGPERLEDEERLDGEESFEDEHEDAGPEEPEESEEVQAEVEDDQPRLEQERPRGADESDVLEGTPDFLEETPEDDELWFEQKPPKDFDFDD